MKFSDSDELTPEEVEYFKKKLEDMQKQIYDESGETVQLMKETNKEFPDPGDRAHLESESITTLRIRDRERKLLKKIKEGLQRLEEGEYNVCEECEELIRKERLEARPVTTLCFNCKEMKDKEPKRFLIIDGYSKQSRDHLEKAGMAFAWQLYVNMLLKYLPEAEYDILLPSDEGVLMPDDSQLEKYSGIIWTGCDLSINDTENLSVSNQIELAKRIYQIGTPSWGSCWGLQIAAVAAGGEVIENPKGREMGFARKIQLTEEARKHPMYEGKSGVFDAYISHYDMVSIIPAGGVLLAGNDFTEVQAMEVRHQNGVFWATQYHPEYDLHEMASLMIAREEILTKIGFFAGHDDFVAYVDLLKALFQQPNRKDLRWQLAVDDDVLDEDIRRCEFKNWIFNLVLPNLTK